MRLSFLSSLLVSSTLLSISLSSIISFFPSSSSSSFSLFLPVSAQTTTGCQLVVPPLPLTATGLSTAYQLMIQTGSTSTCTENLATGAFAQATIIDLDTNNFFVYNPLVVTAGTAAAIPPKVPVLPPNNVVVIHFGANTNAFILADPVLAAGQPSPMQQGKCVTRSGADASAFGNFASCNAAAFFNAVNTALVNAATAGGAPVNIPAPGVVNVNGIPHSCSTIRDFGVVSDTQDAGVTSSYLMNPTTGLVAVDTPTNRMSLANLGVTPTILFNLADQYVLSIKIGQALGCAPFIAPDLGDVGTPPQMISSAGLNEVQAIRWANLLAPQNAITRASQVALVPANNPSTTINALGGGRLTDINKLNDFRVAVGQPTVNSLAATNQLQFCLNLYQYQPDLLELEKSILMNVPSPGANAINLYLFLAARLINAWTNLACPTVTATGGNTMLNAPYTATVAGAMVTAVTLTRVVDPRLPGPAANTIIANGQPVTVLATGQQVAATPPAGISTVTGQPAALAVAAVQLSTTNNVTTNTFNLMWFLIGMAVLFGAIVLLGGLVFVCRVRKSNSDTPLILSGSCC